MTSIGYSFHVCSVDSLSWTNVGFNYCANKKSGKLNKFKYHLSIHFVMIKSSTTERILILLFFWFVPLTKANINNQKRLSFLFILYEVNPMSSASCYVEVPLFIPTDSLFLLQIIFGHNIFSFLCN